MTRLARLGLVLALAAACSDSEVASDSMAETPEELARLLSAAIVELRARPEHTEPRVTIQHLLVAVQGSGVPGADRTPAEAEAFAAELLARARRGEDFDTLVKNYTNDAHPGVYVMVLADSATPPAYSRSDMTVPGFGDVAWRLAVGELGVAPYDGGVVGQEARSPLGYHLIKRLQ